MTQDLQHDDDAPAEPSPPAQRKKRPGRSLLIAGLAGIVVVAGFAVWRQVTADPMQDAVDACFNQPDDPIWNEGLSKLDDDSIEYDTRGEDEELGGEYSQVICLLDELEAPGRLQAEIENTRALDGRRDFDWDGWAASWSYHPDTGLNLVLTRA